MESSVAQPIQERFRSRAPMHTARPAERRHRRMISVSFLISTFNRRDILLATLRRLHECGLPRAAFEVVVVDNASSDGTAQAVTSQFPRVKLIVLCENRGSCAKNEGLRIA